MELFGVAFTLWTVLKTIFLVFILSTIFEWVQFLAWRRRYKLTGLFPFPLLGTLPYILGKAMNEIDDYVMRKYGPVSCGGFGAFKTMTVYDPEILKKIFIKEHAYFVNRTTFGFDPPPLEKMLLNLKDTDWKRVRSILTPTFSAGKLKKMTPEINYCTRLLVDGLTEKAKSGEIVDSRKHAGCFTMDVIAGTAFGIRPDSYNNPDDPFTAAAQKVFGQSTLGPAVLCALMFPKLTKLVINLTKTSLFYPLDSIRFFCDVIRNIVKEREEKHDTERTDLLQLMLNAELVIDGESKKLTEDEILAQGFIVFIAGYETTAALLTFLSHVLVVHPEIQEKLVDEINANLPDDEEDIQYDRVMEMPYLEQVINETLRMYPPVNRMDRCSSGQDVQIDGFWFPSDTPVSFSIWMMHHDEKFYPDPETFRPERFSSEEKAKRDPFVFMPFGHGPRNCIGMRLALLEVKIAVVGMLRKLRFVKCEETETDLTIDVDTFVRTKNPIKVKVELR